MFTFVLDACVPVRLSAPSDESTREKAGQWPAFLLPENRNLPYLGGNCTMKSSTTIRYAGAHGFYWAAACSIVSFAAVYLQLKGFDAAEVGILLSLATIASAVFQPILASAADRSRRWVSPLLFDGPCSTPAGCPRLSSLWAAERHDLAPVLLSRLCTAAFAGAAPERRRGVLF